MGKLITCKDCGNSISKKAKTCPKCGAPTKSKPGCIQNLFSLIILIALLYWGVSSCFEGIENMPDVPWDQQDNSSMAYIMCENWVKERLKSPSTAEFPSVWDGKLDKITKANQRYYIVSYVDSQNSFGATVRTNWTCSTTQTSEDNWQLNSLSIDQ